MKKGFTLIELLVSIAIVGILTAVVLAALSTAAAKEKCAKGDAEACAMLSDTERADVKPVRN